LMCPTDRRALYNSALASLHQAQILYRRLRKKERSANDVDNESGEEGKKKRGISVDSMLMSSDPFLSIASTLIGGGRDSGRGDGEDKSGTLNTLPVEVARRFAGRLKTSKEEFELREQFNTASEHQADLLFQAFLEKMERFCNTHSSVTTSSKNEVSSLLGAHCLLATAWFEHAPHLIRTLPFRESVDLSNLLSSFLSSSLPSASSPPALSTHFRLILLRFFPYWKSCYHFDVAVSLLQRGGEDGNHRERIEEEHEEGEGEKITDLRIRKVVSRVQQLRENIRRNSRGAAQPSCSSEVTAPLSKQSVDILYNCGTAHLRIAWLIRTALLESHPKENESTVKSGEEQKGKSDEETRDATQQLSEFVHHHLLVSIDRFLSFQYLSYFSFCDASMQIIHTTCSD